MLEVKNHVIIYFLNIHSSYRTTRNPYNIGRIAGGSSSGSAAVVAAGLCPAAIGVDGGGNYSLNFLT